MPRKPVRGRYSVVVPLEGGGSLTMDTRPDVSLTPAELVVRLRECADKIEQYCVPKSDAPAVTDGHGV
jgi:hypothetical protein